MKKILLGAMLLSFGSLFAQETTATLAWDYPMSQLWWEWTQGGSAQFGDMNNDGNFDLLISNQDKTVLYEYNNGWYGTDSKIFDGLNDLKAGDIQWLDYNNDGYLDFIIVACTD
ncbi:MAG: VCBS repeat-containing protein, partial [Bacteroidaceae bacterium]|nr:VCBS repeat-containing protein [Bacteroidaceae bacterium]